MVLRTDNDCTTIRSQPCQTTLPRIFLQKNVAGGFAVSIRQSPSSQTAEPAALRRYTVPQESGEGEQKRKQV